MPTKLKLFHGLVSLGLYLWFLVALVCAGSMLYAAWLIVKGSL